MIISTRGLVLGYQMTMMGKGKSTLQFAVDPAVIRRKIVYWDVIDWPVFKNPFMGMAMYSERDKADLKLLESEKILLQTNLTLPDPILLNDLPNFYQRAQIELTRSHNKSGDSYTQWSLGQTVKDLSLPASDAPIDDVFTVELSGVLPIPNDKVPLEDILKFKQKRRDELLMFRSALDNLFSSMTIPSMTIPGNLPKARTRAVEQIQLSMSNLHKAFKDAKIETNVMSMKTVLSTFVESGGAGIGLAGGALSLGVSVEIAISLGLVAGFLRLLATQAPKPKELPIGLLDYAYLYYIETELNKKRGFLHRK